MIVDLEREVKVDVGTLSSVADFSPYEGYPVRGWPAVTVTGGQVVGETGAVVAEHPRGRDLPR